MALRGRLSISSSTIPSKGFRECSVGSTRAIPHPKARAIRRIGGGDPPTVDLTQPHVHPERRAAEPKDDHGAGIAHRPYRPPCDPGYPRAMPWTGILAIGSIVAALYGAHILRWWLLKRQQAGRISGR